MKVAVIVIVYNIPAEVTILQVEAMRKFCKDEHEIFIIDNSTDKNFAEATRYHTGQLGVHYMKTNASSMNGSDSHSFAAGVSYERFKDVADYLVYFDHDLIPVCPFSVVEILGEKVMAGLGQQGQKTYMWAGCVMLNLSKIDKDIVDFSPDPTYKLDTGGKLWSIIENYGIDNCIFFNESYHENPYINSGKYRAYSMINDEMFLHFTAASGWNEGGANIERINSLINITREKINATS